MRLAILAATLLFTSAAVAQTPGAVTSAPLAPATTPAPVAAAPVTPAPTAAAPVIAAPKPAAKPKAPALTTDQRFEKANTSHDGKLTKAQATTAKWTTVTRNFATIDKDKKGYVTVEEIKAAAAKKPAPKKPATPVKP
jgi:hypothetical protein